MSSTLAAATPQTMRLVIGLYRLSHTATMPEVLRSALDAAMAVTRSTVGCVHLVDARASTAEVVARCDGLGVRARTVHRAPVHLHEIGIWGRSVAARRPRATQAAQLVQVPDHPPVHRHLGVPVVASDQVEMVLGVGDSGRAFTPADIQAVALVAEHGWLAAGAAHRRQRAELAWRAGDLTAQMSRVSAWWYQPARSVVGTDGHAAAVLGLTGGPVAHPHDGAVPVRALLSAVLPEHRAAVESMLALSGPGSTASLRVTGRRSDGSTYPLRICAAVFTGSHAGDVEVRGTLQDCSVLEDDDLPALATGHDALTGLPDLVGLQSWLDGRAQPRSRRTVDAAALHSIRLDGVERINQVHGRPIGDEVLRRAARSLLRATREGDLVVHQGGGRFVVIQAMVADSAQALLAADRLAAAVAAPQHIGGVDVEVPVRVGSCLLPAADLADPPTVQRAIAWTSRTGSSSPTPGARTAGSALPRPRQAEPGSVAPPRSVVELVEPGQPGGEPVDSGLR